MAQEIELKLSLPQALHQRFANMPLLQRYTTVEAQILPLQNCYFDTPEQLLNRHAVALRVRRSGDQYIQTLKTRGSSLGGLHQRQEWEWLVADDQLDLSLLPQQALPETVSLDSLAVAFNTDFQRSCWMLDYPYQDQLASIELVLDSGWVTVGQQRDAISEVELELKAGPAEALFALALELAAEMPLRISRISKAERGYRLHQPERARQILDSPALGGGFDPQLTQIWLERIQALLESYLFTHQATLLAEVQAALDGIKQQLEGAGPLTSQLLAGLQQQQQSLNQLLAEPYDEAHAQQWIEGRLLGLCLLQVSQWLYLQSS
ncbi:MAG: CYTH domain-containing protein [Halopseudomonas sp.]